MLQLRYRRSEGAAGEREGVREREEEEGIRECEGVKKKEYAIFL